jgi:hypothetical protein
VPSAVSLSQSRAEGGRVLRCSYLPLPFSCPFSAPRSGTSRQGAARSGSPQVVELEGVGARSGQSRQAAASSGKALRFWLRTRRPQVRVLQGAPPSRPSTIALVPSERSESRGRARHQRLPHDPRQAHPRRPSPERSRGAGRAIRLHGGPDPIQPLPAAPARWRVSRALDPDAKTRGRR